MFQEILMTLATQAPLLAGLSLAFLLVIAVLQRRQSAQYLRLSTALNTCRKD